MTRDNILGGIDNRLGFVAACGGLYLILGFVFSTTSLEIVASEQTTRLLLNSLAIAQSSALAIVASVTLLNVQLVADKYSTELVKSSLRSSSFKYVLFSFVGSIAFALILLYNIEHHGAAWFTTFVVIAATWTFANSYALYYFIFNSIGVLTPGNLITTITNHEPVELAQRTTPVGDEGDRKPQINNENQEEPLYQLYVIILSSVGSINYYVVQHGLTNFRTLLGESINELDQSDGEKLCQKAFLYYYPRIVEHCSENNETEQAKKAVNDLIALLEMIESQTDGWHEAHFSGLKGLFMIRDVIVSEPLIDDKKIIERLESQSSGYWTKERLEHVFSYAEDEVERDGEWNLLEEIILQTHSSVISCEQDEFEDVAEEPLNTWETQMEGFMISAVSKYRETDPQSSERLLGIWPQLYNRTLTQLGEHRKWLVTITFELAVLHAAFHKGGYESGKNALVNTLRGAQPQHTRGRIESLQRLTKRYNQKRRSVAILKLSNSEGHPETAYQYANLVENMVSEAINEYRKENWDTYKAIEFIRDNPMVIDENIDDIQFMEASANMEYDLISNPEFSDGYIIKLVIAEEIDSKLIDTLTIEGVSRYLCIGPSVTGDFNSLDIETKERSLPELRPPSQKSIYEYYNWD